ncbi:amidohydrolase [Feifania hominis]|uniref:Amidohydrolase n=1 Tax=Feifania hominis TaxID=2763660 RepID=A0A926DEA1_9FIRM|nr:amidohydrolase [Feifania hominis]MBC8536518.1 amidohydrolase [Feifania hominis]
MKTIYFGGDIVTMERGPAPEAMVVEDGLIAALGGREELMRRHPDAVRRDLDGCTLLPAFLDSHSHITAFSTTLGLCQLDGVKSFDEMVSRLRAFAETLPAGQWIVGFGYDHNTLAEGRHPDRAVLDRVADGRPVMVSHMSGHMGVLSTAALAEAHITAASPDPAGGRIGRGPDGEPDGYLEEAAFTGVGAAMPAPTMDQLVAQLERAQQIYLSHGVTTAQEGLMKPDQWAILSAAASSGRLRIDTVCYPDMLHHRDLMDRSKMHYENHLRIGGYKILLDGSPQGRTAWMSEPYEGDDKDYRGYPIHEDDAVEGFFETAYAEGVQLLVHCNGDAAADQMLAASERARAKLPSAPAIRPVMIHAQLVRRDQLARMARDGVIASFFVAHVNEWGEVHRRNFGRIRAAHISPAASALREGVTFTFHQDTPVLPPDMLHTVWCAVNRVTKTGDVLGPQECISPLEALKAVTINAAYQYFEENEKGSLRAGKRADLVILSANPLTVAPDDIRSIEVLETIKDGETLFAK